MAEPSTGKPLAYSVQSLLLGLRPSPHASLPQLWRGLLRLGGRLFLCWWLLCQALLTLPQNLTFAFRRLFPACNCLKVLFEFASVHS